MARSITGQSIKTEPKITGFDGFHKTGLERYQTAKRGNKTTKLQTIEKTERGNPAHSTAETVIRTLGDRPRQKIVSTGLTTAPLISGLASDSSRGAKRSTEITQHANILADSTRMNVSRIPQV